jgi:antitoxin CptB
MPSMATTDTAMHADLLDAPLDERGMSKLKWRCRRGLLENDLFIERFFARHEQGLTVRQAQALGVVMDLSDNDLLDQLLGRKSPEGLLGEPDVLQVLKLLRNARSTV